MPELRHFILRQDDDVDHTCLRQMVAGSDPAYEGCDIYDLRAYPLSASEMGGVTLDSVITHLISLRCSMGDWTQRRKAVVLLPPVQSETIEIAFAQMRSMGLLAVVAVTSDAEVSSVRGMGAQMASAPVLQTPRVAIGPQGARRGIRHYLRKKLRTI